MTTADVYHGRLAADGDGNLLACDENGDPDGRTVYHDVEAGVYRFVEKGGLSHNERHEKRVLSMNGTSGPLFDADGKQVFAGDPHHERPLENDPHYAADGGGLDKAGKPTFTRTTSLDDEAAPTATSHTEAYT